jgi:2-dehydro-3-deoxyphosphogluconate aldolase/(4S)-4-hydroxy-2-oxoglutarate aldolase
MIPTGGVNLETAADFLRAGADALGVGAELVAPAALKSGDCSEITRLARCFLAAIAEVKRPVAAIAQAK